MPEMSFEIETHRFMQTDEFELVIREVNSHEVLAKVRLTPSQAWRLFGGTVLTVDGVVSPRLDRVGKVMETGVCEVTSAELAHLALDPDVRMAHAVEVAKQFKPGWESYEPRRKNHGGIDVVLRRWVDEKAAPARAE